MNMVHNEGFLTNENGLQIYHQQWLPEGEVKAILFLVHGIAEHSGRYINVVNYFLPKGYMVVALDHEGHGKSEGTPMYVKDFNDYVDVIKSHIDTLQAEYSKLPVYMVGHSMGGLISAHFSLHFQSLLAGMILSGPPVTTPKDIPAATIFAGKLLARVWPRAKVSRFLDDGGISRDPKVVAAFRADPLVCHGKVTAGLGMQILHAMEYLLQNAKKITLPVLIVNGGADLIVNPDDSALLYEKIGSVDKTHKEFEGLYHDIFNEPERLEVFQVMEGWLERRLLTDFH